MSEVSVADRDRARRRGCRAGRNPGRYGGDCPYGFDVPILRSAWFLGFRDGRQIARLIEAA